MKTLVTQPAATSFVQIMATATGRKARLGDAEKLECGAAPFVLKADIALRDAINTVARLTDDKTRTEVARHAAARKVALDTVGTIRKAATDIAAHADTLNERAMTSINSYFDNALPGDGMTARISAWVADTLKSPEGVAKVKQAAKEDRRVAAVLHAEPLFLTGITKGLRDSIVTDVIATRLPDAAKQLTDAADLHAIAPKYEKLAAELPTHLYNSALADQADTRVEI
ncbi:hypothetical protein [Paraburkholderia flava]|uniref:hypothetical protein n=1 Tax=Paraburkholderia flava TaxID=2547393 RepID=UPI00105C6C05|nr:hypothetical protein [Paraburkholderia flava]